MLDVHKFVGLLVETLAQKLHEIESQRFEIILKNCKENEAGDGSFVMPAEMVSEMIELCTTPYEQLDEEHMLYYKSAALSLTDAFEALVRLLTVGTTDGVMIKGTDKFFNAVN